MQELFDKNIFMYIMFGLCLFGVLLKLILDIEYSRLVKASDNMGTAKNKLTQLMKKKFETCYKLKIGVNNVDIFVDKYVYRHRFCGILLSTWENIGGQVLMLCLLIGSISAVLGLIYECGKQEILSTFSAGILTSGLLIFLEGLINLSGKRDIIRLNMKDYLENFFKVRLEQELYHPELIEQYKKDLLTQGEAQSEIVSPVLEAVTEIEDIAEFKTKAVLKAEKRAAIKQEKELKKAKALEEREKEKEERRQAIIKRRETIDRRRKEMRETEERIRREAKLALEQKREKERAEIEQKKAQAKALDESRREEKYRQEEIKRALLLEKQVKKEEKQKHAVEHKTLAQEKKEILKKEIQERRSLDGRELEKPAELVMEERDIVSVTELEEKVETVKASESIKAPGKLINSKKQKQSDPSEEKLIEDILKEFLA